MAAFALTRTEVTVAQYRACVDAGACAPPQGPSGCNSDAADREDHPVNCVDWNQAQAFAAYTGGGARLPSEAEWEYAARSGGRNQEYPWGDEAPTCARVVMDDGGMGCGQDHTFPVCSRPDGNSTQGLCDLAGNLYEWVDDWFHDTYDGAPVDGSAFINPPGLYRIFRGGSWGNRPAGVCAARYRDYGPPDYRGDRLGFRLARSL